MEIGQSNGRTTLPSINQRAAAAIIFRFPRWSSAASLVIIFIFLALIEHHIWWENTNAIMSIGEDVGSLIPAKVVLENALMLMTKEEIQIAAATCKAAQHEKAACEVLKNIITRLD